MRILLSTGVSADNYIAAVGNCGGIAVAKYLPEVDTSFDGLILCGGTDIHPSWYGEEINGSVDIDDARDQAEFALAKAYVEAGKPVLGICRGCQLLNVFFGGSLIQNLDTAQKHVRSAEGDSVHAVRADHGSIAASLYGDAFCVNSSHHQAVKKLGNGLRITMTTEDDRVVEGFEHESLPVFAVQWHPERMSFAHRREDTVDGAAIFEFFMQLCSDNRRKRT